MFSRLTLALLVSSIFASGAGAQDSPFANFDGLCFDGGGCTGLVEITDGQLGFCEESCQLGNPIAVKGMNGTLFDVQCVSDSYVGKTTARMFFLRYGTEINGEIGLIATNDGSYSLRNCSGGPPTNTTDIGPSEATQNGEMPRELKELLQETLSRITEELPLVQEDGASNPNAFIWSRHGNWNVVRDGGEPINCFAETFVDTALGRTGVYLGWAAGGENGLLAISNARWGAYQPGVHGLQIFFDGNLALNGNSTFEIDGFPAPQFSIYLTADDFDQIKSVIAAHDNLRLSFFKSNSPKSLMVETDVLSLRGSAAAISDMVKCQSEIGPFEGEPVSADSFILNPNPK